MANFPLKMFPILYNEVYVIFSVNIKMVMNVLKYNTF